MSILDQYKSSSFYGKYKDTYFSDSIMENVFGVKMTKHRIFLRDYSAVFLKNIEVIRDFIDGYISGNSNVDEKTKWLMLRSIYIDPDNKSIKSVGGIDCTADGLISLRRIYDKYGIGEKLVKEYEKCRRSPIIHFPKEMNGINMSRAAEFGDRIDHTLFDLKRLCEGNDDCRLKQAYGLPKTSEWLKYFNYDFGKIVEWLGIDTIFVKNNEVLDLEKNDGAVISKYKEIYEREWSDAYYENLKSKINQFENINKKE